MVDEVDKPKFELPFGRINRSAASQDNFRTIPREKPSLLDRAGGFVRGFSAGAMGQGPDFIESVRNQRKQKDIQLLQATVMDANSIQDAIRKENMPKAVDILVDRMNLLEEGGEDYEDTKMLRDALIGGRPDIVMSEIDTFLKGLPEQVIDPKMLTDKDQLVTRKFGGDPIATTVAGTTPEAQDAIRPMTDQELVDYRIPTGSSATINTRTGEPKIIASAESAADYQTFTIDGVEKYANGPFAGLSLDLVAQMRQRGEISGLGNALPSSTLSTAPVGQEVRPRPAETPNLYAGLSSQQEAIARADREEEGLEQERAAAEEARKVAVEATRVAAENEKLSQVQIEAQKANLIRLNELADLRTNRMTGMETAQQFLDGFRSGEKGSGAGRKALSFLPFGTYTPQGQFDEALDSFAEFAAREKLKASGEIRPTDADVKGAKQALFGIGRDEAVNINLLETFIRQQQAAENEYQALIDARTQGTLEDYIPNIDIPTGGVPSFMQPEGELDKAINRLNSLKVTNVN